jgi:transglutaminase-like putative cysteine protease
VSTQREPDPTLPAAVALTLLTLAAAVGMGRLFDAGEFLLPFLVAALTAHWLAWAWRRLGLSLATALPLSLFGLLVACAWTLFPHTTAYGIPWAGTWGTASSEAAAAWRSFATVVAPVPPEKGFLLAGMIGIGTAAVLADWAAFRVRAVFEAAIPAFALFVFTAVLGAPHHRGWAVAGYLAALLLFVLVHQASMATESASWFASRSRGGVGALLQGGAVLGALTIGAAVFLGPNLPGTAAEPIISWRDTDRSGPGKRVTVSPLVDIRGRLVEQSDTEVFSVKASQPAYWRLTSLDTFDGRIWQSNDSYKPVRSNLPDGVPTQAAADIVLQEFTVGSLASIWLPAAYRPERLDGLRSVSFNEDTGSLITRSETTDGLTYRLQSALPRPTADELGQARPPLVDADLRRYLDLPPIPTRVRRQAVDLTRQAPTPFAKARALQDWFVGEFQYDLDARAGHDGRALERFLFQTKRGYCEQFAGAYAVMARAVGLPARVAVGFTQGELGPDGRYHVRGLNAHAWPEVWIEGYGWTYFEPTPGRGMPGSAWTGRPAAQAAPDNPEQATTTVPTTAAPDTPEGPTTTAALGPATAGTPDEEKPSIWRNPLVVTLLVLLALLAAYVGAVVTAKRMRRNRRRAAASLDIRERVAVAWTEACEALASAGVPRRPAETMLEYAARAPGAARLPSAAGAALRTLATDAAVAGYAAGVPAAEVVYRAIASAATVERALHEQAERAERARRLLDPRPLLPSGARRRVEGRVRSQQPAA